jgi:Protein of unknown function (DUF3800)
MHLLFIDESGRLLPPTKNETKHFVLGGVVIPEFIWPKLAGHLLSIKNKYRIQGEIKWRYFAPNSNRLENTLRHIPHPERDALRMELFDVLCQYPSVKVLYAVPDINKMYAEIHVVSDNKGEQKEWDTIFPTFLYHATYSRILSLFQLHLDQLAGEAGQEINGLVVCDHRNPREDADLQQLHQDLIDIGQHARLNPKIYPKKPLEEWLSIPALCSNLIEGLFLAPSHHSVGIQFADMVAGAVFRKYEKGDERFYAKIEALVFKPPS